MLLDDFVAYPDTEFGRSKLAPSLVLAYRELASRASNAPMFILNRDAAMMAHNISESTPKRFLGALSMCRLPFPRMWIEFVYKDRADWLVMAAEKGIAAIPHKDASAPSRLGYYLEQLDEDGREIMIQPVWNHPEMNTLSICHLTLILKTNPDEIHADNPETGKNRDEAYHVYRNKNGQKRDAWTKWVKDDDEMEAAFELESRLSTHVPEYLVPMWSEMISVASKKDVEYLRSLADYDLNSEWRFVMALLTMLNSRNIIDYSSAVDHSKINKQRVKKGHRPLLSHREIRLSLSRVQKNRLGGEGNSKEIQSHLVRGHIKWRKSKDGTMALYWWNPFVRGSVGAPVANKRYVIDA